MFNDKESITLSARNVLDSRIQDRVVVGDNFRLESESKRIGRRVTATFIYKFNRKKGQKIDIQIKNKFNYFKR